jgi:hypothetical protein
MLCRVKTEAAYSEVDQLLEMGLLNLFNILSALIQIGEIVA